MNVPEAAPPSSWVRSALAALNSTAAMLPLMLGWAAITYGALGPAGTLVGLTAAAVASVLGSVANLALSRAPMPSAASSSSAALLLGACVVQLLRDESFRRPGSGLVALLAAASLAVIASGLIMIALGWLRAGVLVRYVPRPVLAGFMNGVAVLMVLAQLPVILGAGPQALTKALAIAAAIATALVVALVRWRWPLAPATLIGLAAGSALALALQAGCAAGLPPAEAIVCRLNTLGALEWSWPSLDASSALAETSTWELMRPHALTIGSTALLLAVVGALESALNLAPVDQRLNRRTDPNREFVALGVANIASGLFAGLPVVYLRLRAIATMTGGGQGARPEALSNLLIVAALFLAMPLVQRVPLAVVAGIVCMLAWALVDQWTRQLVAQWWRGRGSAEGGATGGATGGAAEGVAPGVAEGAAEAAQLRWSLAIVATVCAVTAVAGLMPGVAAGVLLAMLLFMRAMNRSLVRLRYSAAQIASRRVYPAAVEARLAPLRERIAVIELEGALFFGNVERLEREALEAARERSDLVLDLRRVSTLDASGAVALAALRDRLAGAGTVLRLAGVTPQNRHGRMMRSQGVLPASAPAAPGAAPAWALYPDADHAIEAAEAALLRAMSPMNADIGERSVPPAEHSLFEGLDPGALAALETRLLRRELAPGERLFAQGDPGRSIYLLQRGSVSVLDHASGQRFVSFSPGMCFGETAVLDGRGRTAHARADVPSTVLELPAALLAEIEREQPAVAARIYRNLALHLSERLREAAAAWRLAAG